MSIMRSVMRLITNIRLILILHYDLIEFKQFIYSNYYEKNKIYLLINDSNKGQQTNFQINLRNNSIKYLKQLSKYFKSYKTNFFIFLFIISLGFYIISMEEQNKEELIQKKMIMEEEQNKLILYYWDTRGLAERIRILLNYCQLPYKEIRYNKQTQSNWFNIKKYQVYRKYSIVSLPLLQDDKTYVSQFQGICTYICLKAGKHQLLGRDLDEKIALTTALTIFRDAYAAYRKYVYDQYGKGDAEQIEQNKQYFKLLIRKHLNRMVHLKGKKSFVCGNEIVWIDIAFAQFLQCLIILDDFQLFKDMDHWKQYQQSIWSIPQIQKYLKSQNFKERPCNNYSAKWN